MKEKSIRNKTITISAEEYSIFDERLNILDKPSSVNEVTNKIFNGNLFDVIDNFPSEFVDLLILDPPYNLNKNFGTINFKETSDVTYKEYVDSWFSKLIRLLKPTATIYMCGDWKCSCEQMEIIKKYSIVRNRITWQREKGRGALKNWKNCSEDIIFSTMSDDFYFDVDSIKLKKKVIAPYKENGVAKDWVDSDDGKYRMTCPSNFIDDVTVPYWSMPENTEHPTQKPEKLIAKLILASCPIDGFVFDPFMGSGTTAVVSKKLNRKYSGIELDKNFCMIAEKRLDISDVSKKIQGYDSGIFLDRNF